MQDTLSTARRAFAEELCYTARVQSEAMVDAFASVPREHFSRRLNNGQPSLWACLYDELSLARGAHVVHVGTGTGYYSAILAEIVGRDGRVTAGGWTP